MYSFSGLVHEIWSISAYLIFLCIITIALTLGSKKTPKTKKRRTIIECIVIIALMLGFAAHRLYLIDRAQVDSYTGQFQYSQRESVGRPGLGTTKFVFWNGEGKKQVYYLDWRSRKEIIPFEPVEGMEYTVYFEETTNIIVAIEEVD